MYVTHKYVFTKKFADKWFCFERFQVVKMFSCADECDGTSSGCNTVMEGEREEGREGIKGRGKEEKEEGGGRGVERSKPSLLFLLNQLQGHVTYALSAPPPLAWPSSFVTITEATSTLSLNALACDSHA